MTTVSKRERLRLYAVRMAAWLRKRDYIPLLLCWATAVFYAFLCLHIGKSPVGSSGYYTYTLQALAWREGKFSLGRDYPWLELAVYQGDWFVSFPPVPSIPLFFLTFLFGSSTPDNLLVKLYVLIGCLCVYFLLRKASLSKLSALCVSLLSSFASCMLALTTDGAVWYQAQTLAYCLICASILLMYINKPTPALVLYAFSVGCRPFHVLYGFPLLALYILQCRKQHTSLKAAVIRLIPGGCLGLCVAGAYAWYNWIRFGNIFEFGHNYLPEFSWQGGTQFSLSHLSKNIQTFILRLPFYQTDGVWTLQSFGFSFLLASPVFLIFLLGLLADGIRKRFDLLRVTLVLCFCLHLFLLLLHRTFGGFQFGARYTCDLLPYAALYAAHSMKSKRWTVLFCIVLLLAFPFAVYGAVSILL